MTFSARAGAFCTFVILVGTYGTSETSIPYLAFAAFVVVVVGAALVSARPDLPWVSWIDVIPALYIVVWAYGFLLGLSMGNDRVAVIRNFAALVLYSMYYGWRYLAIPLRTLLRVVAIAGLVNAAAGFVGSAMAVSLIRSGAGGAVQAVFVLGEQRLYYSTAIVVCLALLAPAMARIMTSPDRREAEDYRAMFLRSRSAALVIFAITLSLSTFVMVSKGFTLGAVAVVSAVGVMGLLRVAKAYLFRATIGLCVLVLVAVGLQLSGSLDLVSNAFSALDASNQSRYEQNVRLLAEMKFWGRGLGARLQSGFSRDLLGYGFEVSYMNVVHKIGIVAVVPFLGYLITLAVALRVAWRRSLVRGAVALGAMGFLIPAAGNPFLISATTVVLHCIALYALSDTIGDRGKRPVSITHVAPPASFGSPEAKVRLSA